MSAGLDSDRFMNNVAFNPCTVVQADLYTLIFPMIRPLTTTSSAIN